MEKLDLTMAISQLSEEFNKNFASAKSDSEKSELVAKYHRDVKATTESYINKLQND